MVTLRPVRRRRLRPLAALCATAVAIMAVLTPPSAGIAAAAVTTLKEVSSASYTLDPAAGAVHVVIETTYTNRKPNSGGFFYFWDHVGTCLHAEATAIKASDSQGALSFTTKKEPAFEDKAGGSFFACTSITVKLRHRLLYRQTTKVRIAFDLVGDPRSTSRVRAGQGYATFPVWAWGDDNESKVSVHLPAGFTATILEGSMTTKVNADGSSLLTAAPTVSREFWVQIQATRRDGFTDEAIALGDGTDVHLRSLQDDQAWADALTPDLRAGLPALRDLIGLPLPATTPIELHELYVPKLTDVVFLPLSQDQGYGVGPYRSATEIAIDESLDSQAALSAAATIWFNDELIRARWADRGLAAEYAAQALATLSRTPTSPTKPDPKDPGAQPLELWVTPYLSKVKLKDEPAFIKRVEQREAYGANASWFVMHALVASVGIDRMRDVLSACAKDQIAYLGSGVPETVAKVDGWQRLLDLVEERGGPDAGAGIEQLFKAYVLSTSTAALLGPRADARAAYAALLAKGAGWSAPVMVRTAMSKWTFPAALSAITDATAILDLRKQVADAAAALGVTTGPALEAAYESASEDFDDARDEAQAELAALAAIAHARATLDAPADLVTTIGLLGAAPETSYDAATAAFAKGDIDGTLAGASAAEAAVAGGAVTGRQRLTIAGATLGALLLLVLVLLLLRRRRRIAVLRAAATPAVLVEPPPDVEPPSDSESPPG